MPLGIRRECRAELLALRIPPGLGNVDTFSEGEASNIPVDVDWRSRANAAITPKQSTSEWSDVKAVAIFWFWLYVNILPLKIFAALTGGDLSLNKFIVS